eukprot:SAG22_NODE_16726_length_319_cov_0.922727_1_plen_98_part_10
MARRLEWVPQRRQVGGERSTEQIVLEQTGRHLPAELAELVKAPAGKQNRAARRRDRQLGPARSLPLDLGAMASMLEHHEGRALRARRETGGRRGPQPL